MANSPSPGLCARCVHMAVVRSDRGSLFIRCNLSAVDSRFPKYPRLPVLSCSGFREHPDESSGRDSRT